MIKVENLTKIYKINKKRQCVALDNVSFMLPDKGFVFIVGKSGSGKSTLLNLIGGLDKPSSGTIIADNNEINKMSEKNLTKYRCSYVGFVFQDYHVIDNLTVEDNITLTLDNKNNDYENEIIEVLSKLEISDLRDKLPKELSGGQKQRVAIARAIIKKSEVLLCDEPTGNLDKKTTKALLENLKLISNDKLVVIVSHNIKDAEVYGDRIIELSEGKIVRDRRRSYDYNNEFRIINNKAYLPHYRDLEDNEIDELNNEVNINNNLEIVQIDNKFIDTKEINFTERDIPLIQDKITKKTFKRFLKIFFTKKINMIVNCLLAAVILVCFAVCQSFLAFDTNEALSDALLKDNIKTLPLHKINGVGSLGSTYINMEYVSENDIEKIREAGYDGKIYKVYSSSLPISSTMVDYGVGVNVETNFNLFYLKETFGTINCDEQYLASLYGDKEGKVNYVSLSNEPKDYGIYIPDYVADSIIMFSNGVKETYEDILGIYKYGNNAYGYINGVFDTNYKNRYEKIIDVIDTYLENPGNVDININSIKEDPLFLQFNKEALNGLAYGFNFSENYEEAVNSNEFRSWILINKAEISKSDSEFYFIPKSSNFIFYDAQNKSEYNYLEGNQILMTINSYNSYFKSNYTLENYKDFIPHNITIRIYENRNSFGKVLIEKEFEIVGLLNISGYICYANLDQICDFRQFDTMNYALILENHDNINKMINVATDLGFVVYSPDVTKISQVNLVLSIFGDFFILIEVFFLIIAIIFLINIGVSSVKKRKYEIGVLKAIGIRNFDIIKSFMVQSIILAVIIGVLSNIGIFVGTKFANFLMIEAFDKILGVVINDLVLINYIPSLVIQDIINIIIISVASFIIPQLLLLRIRPIEIIRARE